MSRLEITQHGFLWGPTRVVREVSFKDGCHYLYVGSDTKGFTIAVSKTGRSVRVFCRSRGNMTERLLGTARDVRKKIRP